MIYVIQSSPMIEKFQRRSRKPFIIARDIYLACHIQECSAMVSKIVAVSVLGFCAVATVAWTTFLGWGLYELLH